MHILVHSPWLPGYTDVVQTVLIILNGWTFFWKTSWYIGTAIFGNYKLFCEIDQADHFNNGEIKVLV